MFLKKLEINGFKSFAGKTTFEFPAGIIGIVGPNGSGKSNIIDAVRWVLGERDAKTLRGEKAQDLIFAGTAKKPRMSQATVSLVFDNTDGQLSVDFNEVVITRKVARDGSSEYLINDAHVRRKDIIDFFSKIKLGSKSMAIIGQGSADMFVSASPNDRMGMVQELLGLKEFELKRHDAELKLRRTHINLDKAEAMRQEVAPRLRALKRQTSRWEKRPAIEQELNTILLRYVALQLADIMRSDKEIVSPLSDIEKKLKGKNAELKEAEAALKKVEASDASSGRLEELRAKRNALREERNKKEEEWRKNMANRAEDAPLHRTGEKEMSSILSTLKERFVAVLKNPSLEDLVRVVKEAVRMIEGAFPHKEINSEVIDKKEDIIQKKLYAEIEKLDGDIASCDREYEEVTASMSGFRDAFKKAFGRAQKIKETIRGLEDEKKTILFNKEKNEYRRDELVHRARSLGADINVAQKQSEDMLSSFVSAGELDNMERAIMRMRGELAGMGEVDSELIKEKEEAKERYEFLTKECSDLSAASDNLEKLIGELTDTIHARFEESFKKVNHAFEKYFVTMFGGGSAKMKIVRATAPINGDNVENNGKGTEVEKTETSLVSTSGPPMGIDINVLVPKKRITGLDMLSGGERSLVSLAALFALISVSPPPFLVLDEADAALDEKNSARFAHLIASLSKSTQFVVVTHNRVTMEAAGALYGITMNGDGVSQVLSLKLEEAKKTVTK